MADREVLAYLWCKEKAAEIISTVLEYVQQAFMNDSKLNDEQKLGYPPVIACGPKSARVCRWNNT